ncbi:MAG: hypothetical protein L3J79_06560, partial [Candidatus Marinimicrobia bacterium]|nr:hypothetical protein [Candidatus Neomarinimicrobiota bacterium]
EAIVYIGDGQLLSRDAAGTSERILLNNQDAITSYAISPNGAQVVFSTSGQKLWISQTDGSDLQSLGSGLVPAWSPNGEWIVFMLTEDDGHSITGSDLFIIRSNGHDRTNISNTPEQLEMHPQWSPDGSWIVYDTEGRGQLFVQQMAWR